MLHIPETTGPDDISHIVITIKATENKRLIEFISPPEPNLYSPEICSCPLLIRNGKSFTNIQLYQAILAFALTLKQLVISRYMKDFGHFFTGTMQLTGTGDLSLVLETLYLWHYWFKAAFLNSPAPGIGLGDELPYFFFSCIIQPLFINASLITCVKQELSAFHPTSISSKAHCTLTWVWSIDVLGH